MSKKILAAAYSHSGMTRDMAKIISRLTGGEYRGIIPKEQYPESYHDVLSRSRVEVQIKKEVDLEDAIDVSDYDVIFVGTPNWFGTMAPPVRTFLSQNDFKGKTVVPFSTHGGGGAANCAKDMKELAEGADFAGEMSLHGRDVSKDNIEKLLESIKF